MVESPRIAVSGGSYRRQAVDASRLGGRMFHEPTHVFGRAGKTQREPLREADDGHERCLLDPLVPVNAPIRKTQVASLVVPRGRHLDPRIVAGRVSWGDAERRITETVVVRFRDGPRLAGGYSLNGRELRKQLAGSKWADLVRSMCAEIFIGLVAANAIAPKAIDSRESLSPIFRG